MRGLVLPEPPPAFAQRKKRILDQLAVPDEEYSDASPKGSVDVGIRELIDEVNRLDGFVTTSSCAGRVSVFKEGSKKGGSASSFEEERKGGGEGDVDGDGDGDGDGGGEVRKLAGVGGKGGGGAWLFVSHDPITLDGDASGNATEDVQTLLGLRSSRSEWDGAEPVAFGNEAVQDVSTTRFIHFKFEPMILHVLTASPEHAQLLLRCGLQAGFRESGAVSLISAVGEQHAMPMVAIRSMGLAFESLIGYQSGDGDGDLHCTVTPAFLRTLVLIANERFTENGKRIERFRAALAEATRPPEKNGGDWEDTQARRERKRAEGLRRREELRRRNQSGDVSAVGDTALDVALDVNLT
ncbi:methyltransferase TYW3-domain-containing protein [Hypoxylon sp. FL0543]|nr:methyltransferase TYW3-domain-containing protein [Hypoxylon sp. FL0543]